MNARKSHARVLSAPCIVTVAAVLFAISPPVRADAVEDFYKGRTLRMIIGYGAGGGYDLYGRIAAEFLGRHLPGKPTIVPQNMPGAGSLNAAKYIYTAAPKDGTVLGSLTQTIGLESVIGGAKLGLDASKFPVIGCFTSNIDLGLALPGSSIKSFEDARKREIIVGGTGGASTSILLPKALNAYAGAKFKIVKGYKGAADVMMAAERGEVQLVGATGVPNILVRHPDWITQGKASIIYQNALKRHKLLPNVPTLPELGTTPEGKAVLRLIASTAEVGRSIFATPGAPKERLDALRSAFVAMLKDPDFLASAKKRRVTIDPTPGEEIEAIIRDSMATPKAIVDKTQALIKG